MTHTLKNLSRRTLRTLSRKPRTMRRLLPFVCVLFALIEPAFGGSDPVLWGGLKPGPFQVGFTVLHLKDRSRSYGQAPERPVQVSLWYPAARSSSHPHPPMRFSDYVVLYNLPVTADDRKIESTQRAEVLQRYRKESFSKDPDLAVTNLLNTAVLGSRNADPAPGRFPLVVYATGHNGKPLTHTPTAEYLASHGYVVAMFPCQGASPNGTSFDTAGQEDQIRDIEFILGSLRSRPMVDASRVSLIGFSFGGGSVVVAAMRIPHIRAVISLDGTISWDHTADIVRAATGYDPTAFRAPLLVLKSDHDAGEDPSIFHSLIFSDRSIIRFAEAEHHSFIASPIITGFVRGTVTSSPKQIYTTVVDVMRRFLDDSQHGTRQEPVKTAQQQSDNLIPPESSSHDFIRKINAPTPEELIETAIKDGNIIGLESTQHALAQQVPGVPLLNAGSLHMLALKFIDQGQRDQAVQVYEFLVSLYPRDIFALNILGDLHRGRNELERAKQCYQQSFSVKPGNGGAVRGLERIAKLTEAKSSQ
jgi:dienelactone hydrolase